MSALPPAAGLALAVRMLEARGLRVTARNERGDSVYLAEPITGGGAIRVSNHARTAKQRRKHPGVATSIVIATPKTGEQIEEMVEAALRMAGQAAVPP